MTNDAQGISRVVNKLNDVQTKPICEARIAIAKIFNLLDVKNIIVVDDEIKNGPSFAEFYVRSNTLDKNNRARLISITKNLKIDFDRLDEDFFKEELQEKWDSLQNDEQDDLLHKMGWTSGRKTFGTLNELFSGYNPNFISFDEWRK